MQEKCVNTVLEALAIAIEKLKNDIAILEYEKRMLKEELELYKTEKENVK